MRLAPAYSRAAAALASGFLTGKYRDEADFGISPRGNGVRKYLDKRGKTVLSALDEAASHHHAKPAQVALAWLMARPGITAPIASATRLDQLNELTGMTTKVCQRVAMRCPCNVCCMRLTSMDLKRAWPRSERIRATHV